MTGDNCPNCGTSLIGEPIPETYRTHRDDHDDQVTRYGRCYCFPYGDATHFRLEVGVEIQGVYDGTLYWVCPSCDHAWPRWTDGAGRLTDAARAHADAHNRARLL